MRLPFVAVLVVALALCAACAGAQGSADSPTARNAATIQARLVAGPWRLVDYRPTVPLEPMLQLLLGQQIRTMVVEFDGQTLKATSPTVSIVRPYTLDSMAGYEFDLVSPNPQGGGFLRSRCQITEDGRRLTFSPQTEPWYGTGLLEREGN